jgi:hypothetical protein
MTLQMERDVKPVAVPKADLQVRLFWLVSGPGKRAGSDLPDSFKGLAGELARLGMAQPRLASQLTIATESGGRFETSAAVALAGSHDLSISGTTTDRKDRIGVSLTISVNQSAPRRPSRRAVSLRTQVSVPFDRPVLLGVTPGEPLTSAFVLQVSRAGVSSNKAGAGLTRIEFRDASWKKVFDWLAEQTQKQVIAETMPTGTFTFHGAAKKTYTSGEVIDILNEALTAGPQKFLLIRRERNFVVAPGDERIDGTLVPRISVHELRDLGKTEIASVVIPLRTLPAEDVVTEVKKLFGPFGEAVVLKAGNRLVLQDCAGNLRRVSELLKEIEQEKKR